MKKLIGLLSILILVALGLLAFAKKGNSNSAQKASYNVEKKWELPPVLNEVSGIDWIGNHQIAAIQDEEGAIFIYDLSTSKIVNRIDFGEDGDYEGIRISEKDAYVLRSDGVIFKIQNYLEKDRIVSEHNTSLSKVKGINVEGLALDHQEARFLIAEKERKKETSSRGIYAVTLNLEKSWDVPAISVDLNDEIFKDSPQKKKNKFNPSEIALHPQSNKYYILDGRNPKLVIVKAGGDAEKVYYFNKKEFAQPEGLTFDENGNLYISNEAGDGPANIMKVSLQ